MRRLIAERFPIREVNEAARAEAPFIRIPKINNLHQWFARRVCGVARCLTLAGVLPAGGEAEEALKELTGLSARKTTVPLGALYMFQPPTEKVSEVLERLTGRRAEEIVVADPMAGGGAIPLESLRLGLKTVAADYNPVSYLILRAALEFPAKFADTGLFERTLAEAKRLIEWARGNLGDLYGPDAENYIFARGVTCPHCRGLVPIMGPAQLTGRNWKGRFLQIEFDREGKRFFARCVDRRPGEWLRKARAAVISVQCPYCGKFFALRGQGRDHAFARWFREHASAMEGLVEGFRPAEEVESLLLRLHIPMVKQVGQGFVAVANDEDELGRFREAIRRLAEEVQQGELGEFIPTDPIPEGNKWAKSARSLGLTKWYMLYNPRQLYVIAKLSQYIARRAEELMREEGPEFGAAVALYLAFGLDKVVDYNTLATLWQGSGFKTGIVHTLRGESTLDFRNEYCELVVTFPSRSLEWALEPDVAERGEFRRTGGGSLPVLRALCEWFKGRGLSERVEVYLADATKFSEVVGEGSLDLLNVDPPYFEQQVYSDKIEFIWAVARRALAPALPVLFPRERIFIEWDPKEAELPREREMVVRGRSRAGLREGDAEVERWRSLFRALCEDFRRALKDDGLLVLWFTHPADIAWRSVGEGLYEAGFLVEKVYPVLTEMPTRYKAQVNKMGQQISLAIVGRKGERERLRAAEDMLAYLESEERFREAALALAREAMEMAKGTGLTTVDAFALILGTAISVATRFSCPLKDAFSKLYSAAITLVLRTFVGDLLRELLTSFGFVRLSPREAEEVERRLSESMLLDASVRAYISLLISSRVDLSKGELQGEPVALDYDFAQTASKLCDFDLTKLRSKGLVAERKAGGRKAYLPLLFEAMGARTRGVPLREVLSLPPGAAIFVTWTAVRETGEPEVRVKSIEQRWREETGEPISREELMRAAAMGLLFLSLLSPEEVLSAFRGLPSIFPIADAEKARSGAESTLKAILFR